MEAELTQNLAARADRELLRAFVDRADGAAFTELVARHGPLVLGACRRVLADAPDAEDAFQATFLILARKAGTVRRPERLGAWLYGVALRCAFRVRKASRRSKEQPMPDLAAPAPPDPHWADVRRVLDTEIGHLPAKLRAALVLCELEGLDRATVADRLGVPIGTVSSRLSRAKERLRRRLIRRGITLSLAALGLYLAQAAAEAATVPPPLSAGTAADGIRFKSGPIAGRPAAIAIQVLRSAQMKVVAIGAAVMFLVLGLIGVGLLVGPMLFWPEDDAKRIQGEWRVVSLRFNGQEMANAPELADMTATFDADEFRFGMAFRYQIIPDQSPKAIDMETLRWDGQMEMVPGVYEFDGDRLTIHLAMPPRRLRPTTVQPVDETRSVVIVLQRVRKDDR
jgi:RNA polymerase sigma factor (sigma-70 family)